jgi:hypothetical protein
MKRGSIWIALTCLITTWLQSLWPIPRRERCVQASRGTALRNIGASTGRLQLLIALVQGLQRSNTCDL